MTTPNQPDDQTARQPDDQNQALRHSGRLAVWSSGLLLLVCIIGAFLRLWQLDAQSLWLDEGSTWATARQDWATLLLDLGNPFSAYPLYHLFMKAWIAIAGDSEHALRLPSALFSIAAIGALAFLTGSRQWAVGSRQVDSTHVRTFARPSAFTIAAVAIAAIAPFAIWHAQEAKVYALLQLVTLLFMTSLLHSLALPTRRAWLQTVAWAVLLLFTHRLGVLVVLGAYTAWASIEWRRLSSMLRGVHSVALLAICGSFVWSMVQGVGNEQALAGAQVAAGPLTALGLSFTHLTLDRGPGEAPWWWFAPWAIALAWGGWNVIRDALLPLISTSSPKDEGSWAARVLVCLIALPLAIILVQQALTRVYEPRYLMSVFALLPLVLAYPLLSAECRARRPEGHKAGGPNSQLYMYALVLIGIIASSSAALFQPERGLFSGAPVKEQYREIIRELAVRVQPDDLVVLHPAYMLPLYQYYMGRFTSDPAPQPVTFGSFKRGQVSFDARDWDTQRQTNFSGHARAFLLIAPEHARAVDAPAQPSDEYGLVGLYFQYSREQHKWPCGIWRGNGIHLLCQASPETYETGEAIRPQTLLQATFGGNIRLLGITRKAVPGLPNGTYRAGGSVPLVLFFDVDQQPSESYSIFLHLCRDCTQPPLASSDGLPLEGYLPTNSWLPHKPARVERSIPLPRDVPPGRYTILLGMYNPGDPSPNARLPLTNATGDTNRVQVTTIEVVP